MKSSGGLAIVDANGAALSGLTSEIANGGSRIKITPDDGTATGDYPFSIKLTSEND